MYIQLMARTPYFRNNLTFYVYTYPEVQLGAGQKSRTNFLNTKAKKINEYFLSHYDRNGE